MFDIGWTEIVMIAILAIIVIGPKDLPKVLRTLGRWVRKARAVAREFQDSLDEVLRESDLKDLKDLKDQVEKASRVDPFQEVKKTVDPEGEIAGALESGAKEPERVADSEGEARPSDPDTEREARRSG